MRVGVVQMQSSSDPWENLAMAQAFAEEAVAAGVQLLCFPENVFLRGASQAGESLLKLENGKLLEDSDFSQAVAQWIQGMGGLALSLGSVFEHNPEQASRPFNSHFFVDTKGVIKSYRKMHLFSAEVGGLSYRESDRITPGLEPQSLSLKLPEGTWRIGLSICYDLRFPELFRWLSLEEQCLLLLVPASFTLATGKAHWRELLRARAIENQCYVLASAQWGTHSDRKGRLYPTFGHSLVIDPWGGVLEEAPEKGDALLVHDLNLETLLGVRRSLPALRHAGFWESLSKGATGKDRQISSTSKGPFSLS